MLKKLLRTLSGPPDGEDFALDLNVRAEFWARDAKDARDFAERLKGALAEMDEIRGDGRHYRSETFSGFEVLNANLGLSKDNPPTSTDLPEVSRVWSK